MLKAIRLQASHQRALHRNMDESHWFGLQRVFWSFVYLAKGIRVGLRAMIRQQLGSEVIYEGKRWFVSNRAGHEFCSISRHGDYRKQVPASEMEQVHSLKEFAHRYSFGFAFYMNSWHSINVQDRIYGRLRQAQEA